MAMNKVLRWILILVGCLSLLTALGFYLQLSWVTQIWPVQSGRLSNIFVSSIMAAIGAPIVWIGLSSETRAMAGGALNLLVANAGFAISTFPFYAQDDRTALLIFGIISIAMVLLCVGLFVFSHRRPFLDSRPIPLLVRASFAVFAVVLLVTATALILRRPNTFPWPLSAENSILYGWIFLGAMCYFLYALSFPVWGNAYGQLLGFLAYDLVLIFPFLAHFVAVKPEMRTSLVIYTAVVSYSGLLAIYHLFIHPSTRFNTKSWRATAGDYS
jgi:hypothetical protein